MQNSTTDYSRFIGHTQSQNAYLDIAPANLMAATLDREPSWQSGQTLPLAWHWLYFHPPIKTQNLAEDGHEKLGHFIPALPLPHRMWAGGTFEFFNPILLGTHATKTSKITQITPKQGRTGALIFVTVEHTIHTGEIKNLVETHTIVYRETTNVSQPMAAPNIAPDFSCVWQPSPLMLFRYSALTFNAHFIHYDPAYCHEQGYRDLIIHGPLSTTLLLDAYQQANPQGRLKSLRYQAKAPVFIPDTITMNIASDASQPKQKSGWVSNQHNQLITEAHFVEF